MARFSTIVVLPQEASYSDLVQMLAAFDVNNGPDRLEKPLQLIDGYLLNEYDLDDISDGLTINPFAFYDYWHVSNFHEPDEGSGYEYLPCSELANTQFPRQIYRWETDEYRALPSDERLEAGAEYAFTVVGVTMHHWLCNTLVLPTGLVYVNDRNTSEEEWEAFLVSQYQHFSNGYNAWLISCHV